MLTSVVPGPNCTDGQATAFLVTLHFTDWLAPPNEVEVVTLVVVAGEIALELDDFKPVITAPKFTVCEFELILDTAIVTLALPAVPVVGATVAVSGPKSTPKTPDKNGLR